MESIVTAWDVYWVMQLDSIKEMLLLPFFACLVVAMVATALFPLLSDALNESSLTIADVLKKVRAIFILCLLCGFVSVALPSSKTAAAMILLPAITSDQVIEPVGVEARELYALAKQALRNVVEKQAEPEPKKD